MNNRSQNQVIADIYSQDIANLDDVNTIVLQCSGPNGMSIKKTFSDTMPQDFNIAMKFIRSMMDELRSCWSENEPYDEHVIGVKIDFDVDDALEEELLKRALEEIKNDREALLNYIVNKVLISKCDTMKQQTEAEA